MSGHDLVCFQLVTVFVSYSSRDKDAVKSLTQDLQDADEQVWMDQRLAGGEAWWRAILEQIRGCGTASHSDHYASRGKSRVYRTAGPTTESLEPRYKDLDCRRFRARGCGGDSGNGRRNPPVSEAGPRRQRFRSNPNVFEPGRHHKRFPRSPIVIAFKPGQRPRRRGLVGAAAVVRCGVVVCGSRR